MITYAALHKTETEESLKKLQASPKGIFFSPQPYIDFEAKISDDTWSELQLVAIHNGRVQGYLKASINRLCQTVWNICICKFCDGHELEFAADLTKIMHFLQQHFRTIRWSTIVGSPTEAIYEKLALQLGGGCVARFTNYNRLRDGRLADARWFEIPGSADPDGLTVLPCSFND